MLLTIQQDIPESKSKDIILSFAKYFVDADFTRLHDILSEDVYIVIFNRERKEGIETVLEYFKNWQIRARDAFECEVRWSAQFSQPELYFTSEKFKQAYIFGIENSKIVRILLTPRSFSAVGFSIDETPYNVGFIKANTLSETEPLPNHNFCPVCGKDSERLNWHKGVIFKNVPDSGKKIGVMVNTSICPDCSIVCEVCPDRTEKFCLTMTLEQQEKANARMTEEQRAEYVDYSMGNKRSLFNSLLTTKTNELSIFGQKFHTLLNQIITDNTPELVFSMLDKLSLTRGNLKLYVASIEAHDIGDESFFYIGDDENPDYKIYKHLKAKPSIEAAWQIYLLSYASTVMPVFWHGGYIVRNYVFDEASLNDYVPLECYDMSGLSRGNLLLPEVNLSPDGRIADVYCTYWNDWKGLIRDHLQITFRRNGKVKLTKIEPLCLFEYECDICF
ncbi:MAG: hypothetical protein HDS54_04665 [Barnesiella sp.]|nr:hypothetical protein [Barnesiella sp.]